MMSYFDRRAFIRTSVLGGVGMTLLNRVSAISPLISFDSRPAQVALTTGDNRADIAFRALEPFANEIRQAIGNRRVVIKPNNVLIYVPLACTHVDTLEGILEFLKSINKLQNVIIAESSASGSTLEGFDNYGYYNLISKYPVKLVDLDQGPSENMYITSEKHFRPRLVKVSSIILDPNAYNISVARMKTHTSVGATLSLKNLAFGAPLKDPGFTLYHEDIRFSPLAKESKPGTVSHKRPIHGDGFHAVNYNIAMLAQKLYPDLALIDGFEGMEGNGPTKGTAVDHRVCVASQDWLAADRVGIELMGIDFSKIGYLNHCTQMGLGISDLNEIEIIGEKIKDHIVSYKLPDNFDEQTVWMNPIS